VRYLILIPKQQLRSSARGPSGQLRTQQWASITLGDLALSRDLPVVSVDMLNAIDGLAEAFGKEGYHLECAGDVARCSRAGSVIYYLAILNLCMLTFRVVRPRASLGSLVGRCRVFHEGTVYVTASSPRFGDLSLLAPTSESRLKVPPQLKGEI
jgi:hypothetical protein